MRKEVLQAGQRVTKSLMRVQVLKSADKPSLSSCAECSDKAPKGKRRRDESADHSDAMFMLGRGLMLGRRESHPFFFLRHRIKIESFTIGGHYHLGLIGQYARQAEPSAGTGKLSQRGC